MQNDEKLKRFTKEFFGKSMEFLSLKYVESTDDEMIFSCQFKEECSNWILAGNAFMNPWVHLQTKSQNYRPVPMNTSLIAEMSVNDFYEKKGHEFIDVNVNLFEDKSLLCCMSINLLAIFKLRTNN